MVSPTLINECNCTVYNKLHVHRKISNLKHNAQYYKLSVTNHSFIEHSCGLCISLEGGAGIVNRVIVILKHVHTNHRVPLICSINGQNIPELKIQTNTVKSHFTRIMFNFITNFISVIIFILVIFLLHTHNA